MRTEFSAYNFTSLMNGRIFHRLASDTLSFKSFFPAHHLLLVQGTGGNIHIVVRQGAGESIEEVIGIFLETIPTLG